MYITGGGVGAHFLCDLIRLSVRIALNNLKDSHVISVDHEVTLWETPKLQRSFNHQAALHLRG